MSASMFSPLSRGLGRMDVVDRHNRYELIFDVPGVAREGLEITLKDRVLIVSGRREGDRDHPVQRFERRLSLPADVDLDGIDAHLADGLLRITIPRGVRARQIPINARGRAPHPQGRTRFKRLRPRRDGQARRSLRRLANRRASASRG